MKTRFPRLDLHLVGRSPQNTQPCCHCHFSQKKYSHDNNMADHTPSYEVPIKKSIHRDFTMGEKELVISGLLLNNCTENCAKFWHDVLGNLPNLEGS
jgi:hypothetical protein